MEWKAFLAEEPFLSVTPYNIFEVWSNDGVPKTLFVDNRRISGVSGEPLFKLKKIIDEYFVHNPDAKKAVLYVINEKGAKIYLASFSAT